MVEARHSAEHLLAVRVKFLQLVLDQHGVQRGALLDQLLSENNQGIDLIGVQCDLLLERLHGAHTHTQSAINTQLSMCYRNFILDSHAMIYHKKTRISQERYQVQS